MKKPKYLIGVDEAGRGPVAGPVCVGLVMIKNEPLILKKLHLKKDSKKLSKKDREVWFENIKRVSLSGDVFYGASFVSASTIDKRGIVFSIRQAISQNFKKLKVRPEECQVFLDGLLKAPPEFKNQETIIKGDEKVPVISLASVVAKVSRDKKMMLLAKKYSDYSWQSNMGYGSQEHYRLIKKNGLSPEHRRSFLKNLNN